MRLNSPLTEFSLYSYADSRTGQRYTYKPGKSACHSVLAFVFLNFVSFELAAQTKLELERLVFEAVPLTEMLLFENAVSDSASLQEVLHQVGTVSEIPEAVNSEPATASMLETDNSGHDSSANGTAHTVSSYLDSLQYQQQEVDLDVLADDIATYQQAVAEIELEGGMYAQDLSQNLISLGDAYAASGQHLEALDAFSQAQQILRVNYGLFSLEQEAVLEKMVLSHLAMGEFSLADEKQEYLYFINQKTHGGGTPELLPALERYANWNMLAFQLLLKSNSAGGAQINSGVGALLNTSVVMEREELGRFNALRLVNVRNIYQSIADIVRTNRGENDRSLDEIERKIAMANFLYASSNDIKRNAFEGPGSAFSFGTDQMSFDGTGETVSSMGYRHGRDALQRRVDVLREHADTDPAAYALALLDLADWYLMFERPMTGLDSYKEVYQFLTDAELDESFVNDLMYPEVPLRVPAFIGDNYSRAARSIPEQMNLAYQGYIDVEFHIARFGDARSIKVLDSSNNFSQEIEERLLRTIRRGKFRPRFEAGELIPDDRLQLRYYYSY